jgi:chromosome segregation ATPase
MKALLTERDIALKAARSDLEKQLVEQIAEKEKHILYTQSRLDDLEKENELLKSELKEERNRIAGASQDGEAEIIETPSMVINAEVMEEEVQEGTIEVVEEIIYGVKGKMEMEARVMAEEEANILRAKVAELEEAIRNSEEGRVEGKGEGEGGEMLEQLVAETREDNVRLKTRIKELEQELHSMNEMYESANRRSSESVQEVAELKRKVADLEEICGKVRGRRKGKMHTRGDSVYSTVVALFNTNQPTNLPIAARRHAQTHLIQVHGKWSFRHDHATRE